MSSDDVAHQLYSVIYYILAAVPVCTKRLVHIHRRREQFFRSKSICFLAILGEITSVTVLASMMKWLRKCCKLLHYVLLWR